MSTDFEKVAEMKQAMHLETSSAKHLEAAAKFEAGMDKVVDVLLMLVLKFGRATTAQIVSLFILFVCLITLVITTINVSYLRGEVKDLMRQQESLMQAQKRIERTTTETKKDMADTSLRMTAAAQSAPKIEVDQKTGKAKLVVDEMGIELKVTPSKPIKKN